MLPVFLSYILLLYSDMSDLEFCEWVNLAKREKLLLFELL